MEIDLAHPSAADITPESLRSHVCIVGAGIAGLTLAHQLTHLGLDVLLLEAGGRTPGPHDAALLADLDFPGHLHISTRDERVRALGGTSLTWGGQLLPLPDETSWPITAAELAPFTAAAERLLGVDDLPYDAPGFFAQTRQPIPTPLNDLPHLSPTLSPTLSPALSPTLSKFAPFSRRNLAASLGRKLRTHPKARIVLHAPVAELLLAPTRDRIEAVLLRNRAGRLIRLTADHIVLAAGTVEIVRLLLASRSVAPEGIGNQHDQLGRNFHDHLTLTAATVHPPARETLLAALRPWIYNGTLHSLKLNSSPTLRAQLGLTPVMAHLILQEPETSGIGALRSLLRARQQHRLAPALRTALPQLPRALADAALLAASVRLQHRRYVSPHAAVLLRLNAAQRTPSASRITLSSVLDPFGLPKPILDWRIAPEDLATLRRFAAHLQTRLQALPPGLTWTPALFTPDPTAPLPTLDDARHAMGGACMGTDPHTSVVTPELRVHGLRNLWIASAATFPDGSPQLPTLPLMALSLRLAHHLARTPRA